MQHVQSRAAEIERIDARVQTMVNSIVGTRNANIYTPRNIEEVQYSLPAQMALSVLGKGNGFQAHHAILEGRLDLGPGTEVHRMLEKVKIEVSPELDANYKHFVADVTVHYKNGTSQRIFEEQSKGSPMKPFTPTEQMKKLDDLTETVIGKSQADRLWTLIDEMRPNRPVSDVTALLVPGA
jgi:2-methylcitrate dehydratase PrpD